jgi:hypothetical protein
VTIPTVVPAGQFLTATATTASNQGADTSEFSAGVQVQPASPAVPPPAGVAPPALDATGQVRVQVIRSTKTSQQLRITDISTGPVIGPLALVLDGLPRKVKLRRRSDVTRNVPPLGSPWLAVNAGGDDGLSPGESVTLVLHFANPLGRRIRYRLRLLAGGVP